MVRSRTSRVLALVLGGATTASHATVEARRPGVEMQPVATRTACSVVVAAVPGALSEALAKAKSGDVLCLAAGEHRGTFTIGQSVTLQPQEPAAQVILRSEGRGPVIRIDSDGMAVRIIGLTIAGGSGAAGGGVSVMGRGRVQIADCRFEDNDGGQVGGGGIYARAGHVSVERCTFVRNRGRQGGAVFFDMAMRGELTRCVLQGNHAEWGGALRVAEAAEVTVKASEFNGNSADDQSTIRVSGTRSRTPKLLLDHCLVSDGGLINGPDVPGSVSARSSRLPTAWRSVLGVRGDNTWLP